MNEEGGGASRSTDPAAGTSSATDVSLREYLMQAITTSRHECQDGLKHLEQSVVQAERNSKDNIEKALTAIDRRFDSVNEFRGVLTDLSKDMAKKTDVDNLADKVIVADKGLEEKFQALWQRNRDDIDSLGRRIDLREGQQIGSRITGGVLVTVITVGIALVGLVVVLANYLTS